MSGLITQNHLVPELLATMAGGQTPDLSAAALHAWLRRHDLTEPELSLIEGLRQEVLQQIRTDAHQALRVAELAQGLAGLSADPQVQATGERAVAIAMHMLSRYREASEHYERARALYQLAGQEVAAARVARALVDALIYQSRYDEALKTADEARAVFAAQQEIVLAAQLESNVGNLYHRLDRNHEALACYERAAAIFAVHAPEQLAQVTYNLANIHSNLDDFRQAQRLYEEAETFHRRHQNQRGAVQARYSLGYLYFLRGSYHQAMRILHEVRGEAEQVGDEKTIALCMLDLAEIHLQLNALPEAASLAAEAQVLFEGLEIRYERARALLLLGQAQLRQQRYDDALTSLTAARAEFVAEGNEVHLGLIDLYTAELRLQQAQIAAAMELAQQAEARFMAQGLKSRICMAKLVQASASAQAQDYATTLRLSREALTISRETELPWLRYQAHELCGDALSGQADVAAAVAQYEQAVDCVEHIRGSIRVDEFRAAFFSDKLRVYEKLIRLCLRQQKSAEAFYYLESARARTLVDLLVSELEITPVSDSPGAAELWQQWQQLREELHWFYSRAGQLDSQPQNRRLTVEPGLRAQIRRRENKLNFIVRQLQAHDPGFVWLPQAPGITVTELQKLLAANEVVIEYYFDDELLRLFVIDRDQLQVAHSAYSLTQINDLIVELRFQFDKFQYGAAYVNAHFARLRAGAQQCLARLYEALLAPIAAQIAGRKLIIIPFGALHNVPFQALYDGQQYLLDQHEIVQMPSARLLELCDRRSEPQYQSALILGAADERAPQITAEIQALQSMFPQARCFTGPAATAQKLSEYAPTSDILHIASHAVFRQDNPMFSAFRLADGWVNFYDVSALRLNHALVTLSGCSTGAQRVYAGDEMMGLARGFLSAGAASLVVSLWAVSDAVTTELMVQFYEQVQQGAPLAAALRAAALFIREEHDHPYYWAPFMLISRN